MLRYSDSAFATLHAKSAEAIVAIRLGSVASVTGLIPDKTQPGSPSSIAAVGMALSVYVVAIERDLLSRAEAIDRTLTVLRFFQSSHQGPEADAIGCKGFYYHFLDIETGRRAWQCELSTVDRKS